MKFSGVVFHHSQHLDDSQLLPPDPSCPFCGSESRKSVAILQEEPQITLLKCGNCKAASASRMPTDEALTAYYQHYYPDSGSPRDAAQVTFGDPQRLAQHLAVRLNKYLSPSSLSIVDFGGGDGTVALKVAEQLLQSGFQTVEITIVDFNKAITTSDDARIVLRHRETLDSLPPLSHDFGIASAIMEHVPNPRETLIELLNVLREGGIFYARTAYAVPLIRLSKLLRIGWDFTFPAHIHDLGQDFWESVFRETFPLEGFVVLESRPSIVARSFKENFLRALVAHALKAPWYILGGRYSLVGGWEVFVRKNTEKTFE